MTIRCITFDWGDTLAANHGQPYRYIQTKATARLGAALSACGGRGDAAWQERCLQELSRVWLDTMDPALNPGHREFDMAALIDGWIADAAVPSGSETAVATARAAFEAAMTDTVLPFAGVREALLELKAAGYRIGILSHVPWPGPACRAWYRRWGLAEAVDFYSLSSEVGWIKPNHRHYDDAVAQAGCAVQEILHVGDHPQRDIIGAQGYGMRTALRMTEGIYDPDELAACRPDGVVVCMREVGPLAAALSERS